MKIERAAFAEVGSGVFSLAPEQGILADSATKLHNVEK